MSAFGAVAAIALVLVVLGVIAYWMLVVPFRHHPEEFRDPQTRRRLHESPHRETRDEFEHRTAA